MSLSIQINSDVHQFAFKDFPNAYFNYQETPPEDPSGFVHFTTVNNNRTFSGFFKNADLETAGISSTIFKEVMGDPEELKKFMMRASAIQHHLEKSIPFIEYHLPLKYRSFFENRAYANTIISSCIHRKEKHLSKVPGIPGMYIHYNQSLKVSHVFINLKKTPILGKGSFGKVRKVLWLDAPSNLSKIVAKKVHSHQSEGYISQFHKELSALHFFSKKKGVISYICGGIYKDKFAIFLPFYHGNLFQYSHNKLFSLPINEKLSVALELIEGLSTISEYGIHGDIKSRNILIKRGATGLEAVISDFGAYRAYADLEVGLTTEGFAPPDYHKENTITLKHDVWGMGLSLYEFFSNHMLPFTNNRSTTEAVRLICNLTTDWILDCPIHPDTPHFFLKLLNQMLNPLPQDRPNPKEAFERLSAEYEIFIKTQKKDETPAHNLTSES
jgi:hypothetical protein